MHCLRPPALPIIPKEVWSTPASLQMKVLFTGRSAPSRMQWPYRKTLTACRRGRRIDRCPSTPTSVKLSDSAGNNIRSKPTMPFMARPCHRNNRHVHRSNPSDNISCNGHVDDKVKKAYNSLGILQRNLANCPRDTKSKCYTSLVRSMLENTSAASVPHTSINIMQVEAIQCRAA